MDILIKNMELPSKCFDCGFCHDGDRIRYCLATPWQKEIRKEVFPKRREDFCPLVALPEHGDLIDRKAVLSYFETAFLMGADMDYEDIVGIVSNPKAIPTIVEATE